MEEKSMLAKLIQLIADQFTDKEYAAKFVTLGNEALERNKFLEEEAKNQAGENKVEEK